MIITAFKGQLGNQLFQYAAARKFAHDGDTELKLDFRSYAKVMDALKIRYFNIIENIATEEECNHLKSRGLLYYLEKFIPYYKRRFVWERDWVFDQNLINIKRKQMYVRGVFQSEEYFDGIQDIIRKEFTLKEPVENKYGDIVNKINSTNSVSIHIRRGDILLGGVRFEKPCMTGNYYRNAVNYITEKVDDPYFFIFSDDISWARENLKFINEITFVSDGSIHDYEELIIMSKCKHNITGNSTFSWWGAWLNENPKKIIVTPKKWFIDPKKNTEYVLHLIPKTWVFI